MEHYKSLKCVGTRKHKGDDVDEWDSEGGAQIGEIRSRWDLPWIEPIREALEESEKVQIPHKIIIIRNNNQ